MHLIFLFITIFHVTHPAPPGYYQVPIHAVGRPVPRSGGAL